MPKAFHPDQFMIRSHELLENLLSGTENELSGCICILIEEGGTVLVDPWVIPTELAEECRGQWIDAG